MLTAGRPRKNIPTVDWKITVPVDVAAQVEELLMGRNGRPKYGARSELIEVLLRQWLRDQDIQGSFAEGEGL